MIVYVEYVLFDNFVIDCCLLRSSLVLSGIKVNKLRIVVCGLLGGAFALVFPTFEFGGVLSFCAKVLFGCFLSYLSAKHRTFSGYLKVTAIFFLFTFFTGGAVTGVYGLLSVRYSSELPVALAFIPAYVFIKLAVFFIKSAIMRKKDEKLCFKVELFCGEKKVETVGFMDTGNGLSYDGEPVIVVDKKIFKKLFTLDLGGLDFKKIAVSTVSGESESLGFTVERAVIYFEPEPNIYTNVNAIVSKTALRYGVILHPELKEKGDV